MSIAGHTFVGQWNRCSCDKRFSDISWATRANVGEMHIAHSGALNEREADEITAERERFWLALTDVAGSSR